jgi:hypothetical protein
MVWIQLCVYVVCLLVTARAWYLHGLRRGAERERKRLTDLAPGVMLARNDSGPPILRGAVVALRGRGDRRN